MHSSISLWTVYQVFVYNCYHVTHWGIQMAKALHYLSSCDLSVVHRDLKVSQFIQYSFVEKIKAIQSIERIPYQEKSILFSMWLAKQWLVASLLHSGHWRYVSIAQYLIVISWPLCSTQIQPI